MKKNKFNFFFRGGGRLLFGVTITLLLSSMCFWACQKMTLPTPTQVNQNALEVSSGTATERENGNVSFLPLSTIPYGQISVVNGILRFANREALLVTTEKLEAAEQSWSQSIQNRISGKTDAEIEAMNIDDYYVAHQFEAGVGNGFSSLRSFFANKEEQWTSEAVPNDANNPHLLVTVPDHAVQSIYNQGNEVMIGDSIFKELSSGSVYFIKNLNWGSLNSLHTMPTEANAQTLADVISIFDGPTLFPKDECRNLSKTDIQPNGSAKRCEWLAEYYWNAVWGYGKVYAETWSRKKVGNSWKKYYTQFSVRPHGYFWTSNFDSKACDYQEYFDFSQQQTYVWNQPVWKKYHAKSPHVKGNTPDQARFDFVWDWNISWTVYFP